MSDVLKKLEEDIKSAMRAREQLRLDTVRLIKSAVKNKEIELIRALTELEFFGLLSTLLKQRRESIEQYEKGGRPDLADKEKLEIEIIQGYLPKQLSTDELNSLIRSVVQKVGATGPKDIGKVMGELKSQTSGRVDGKILADTVKQILGSL